MAKLCYSDNEAKAFSALSNQQPLQPSAFRVLICVWRRCVPVYLDSMHVYQFSRDGLYVGESMRRVCMCVRGCRGCGGHVLSQQLVGTECLAMFE